MSAAAAANVYYSDDSVTLLHGAALQALDAVQERSIDCVVTSPPYFGLRDYSGGPVSWPAVEYVPMKGLPPVQVPAMQCQLGLEEDPLAFIGHLVLVFRQVHRVLADDGVAWLNIADSYAGKANAGKTVGITRGHGRPEVIPHRPNTIRHASYKGLIGIPARLQLALIADGWTVRNRAIWHKPNATPERAVDRLSVRHEDLYLLSKGPRYWFDKAAIAEPGSDGEPSRGAGDVWTIPTQPYGHAHFAVMPLEIARRCVAAGCKPGGRVLDPFHGSGTTGAAAGLLGRRYTGVDASRDYLELSLRTRLAQSTVLEHVQPA